MRLPPSWRTFTKSLLATAFAAFLASGLVYYFGFPSGGGELGAVTQARAERAERQREELRELEASLEGLVESAPSPEHEQAREQRRQEREAQAAAVRERRAALGPSAPRFTGSHSAAWRWWAWCRQRWRCGSGSSCAPMARGR